MAIVAEFFELLGLAAPSGVCIAQNLFAVIDGGFFNPPPAQLHQLFGGYGLVGAHPQNVVSQQRSVVGLCERGVNERVDLTEKSGGFQDLVIQPGHRESRWLYESADQYPALRVQSAEVVAHRHLRGVEHLMLPVVRSVDDRQGEEAYRCVELLDGPRWTHQLAQLK